MRSDHTPTQRTYCRANELTRFMSALVGLGVNHVQSQTLRKTWPCGMQVFVSMTPHLHCKRHDKTTRRDIIANKKERKKSTLRYLQLTSRARSSLVAASLPASSQCCLGVFNKQKQKTMTFMRRISEHK